MRRLSWTSLMLAAVLAGSACAGSGLATQETEEQETEEQPSPTSPPWGDPWEADAPDPDELRFGLEVKTGPSVTFTLRMRNQRDERLELLLGWGPALFMVTEPDRKPVWWTGVGPELTTRPSAFKGLRFEAYEEKAFSEEWNRYTLGGSQAAPGEYLAWVQVVRELDLESGDHVRLAAGPVEFTLE